MAHPAPALTAAPAPRTPEEVLAGAVLRPLLVHGDARGQLAEFYRADWADRAPPVQWTMTVTEAGVLRGVHVHLRHTDYLVILLGSCSIALRDLRPGSPTAGRAVRLELLGTQPATLVIPPGVAHGLYFPERTVYALGLSRPYDLADELGCNWRDPELGIDWPVAEPRLSERDATLPPLRTLLPRIPTWEPA